MDVADRLQKLFDAERSVRGLHAELAAMEPSALLAAIAPAAREMLGSRDTAEANLRLVRMAELLVDVEGEEAVDLLIDILGSPEAEARLSAGDALEERGYSRYKELALGVERAVERLPSSSTALQELPYLLAEIPEPSVTKLLARFLGLSAGETVGSAIEALVEVGDPGAIKLLQPLEKDTRLVDVANEAKVTVGELAKEAIDLLRRMPKEAP